VLLEAEASPERRVSRFFVGSLSDTFFIISDAEKKARKVLFRFVEEDLGEKLLAAREKFLNF
jgi:DNA repair photolyase